MAALMMSENNPSGSLEGSDSEESGKSDSEPYEMYLTVGEGGYSVSTAIIDKESDNEAETDNFDEVEKLDTSGNIEPPSTKVQNHRIDINDHMPLSDTRPFYADKERNTETNIAEPSTVMDTPTTPLSMNNKDIDDLYNSPCDKSSDTESYSLESDADEQGESSNMLENGFDGNTDISIKTEPESYGFEHCESSINEQSSDSSHKQTTDSADISPAKMFSLRLNLFSNERTNNSNPSSTPNIDFRTLDNVIAAAVSKTYNKDGSAKKTQEVDSSKTIQPVLKPVEETRSGVIVADVPLHIEGKLFHSCSICQKLFKTPKELRVHSRVHTKEKPYACYVCGKAFRQQAHLNSHYKIHSGEKPYSCTLCPLSFTENSSLKRHIRIHLGIRPYKCDLCDDAFVTSYLLKTHKSRRHEDKQNRTRFTCNRCPKVYTSKETFNKHLRSHDPDTRISCSICGQVCLTSSHLKRHVNVHARTDLCNLQSKDKPFECGICQKKYFNKKHLELHVLRHTQTENYSCEECGKEFDSRCKWKRHLRRAHCEKDPDSQVTDPELNQCHLCSKCFRTKDNLEVHIKRVHEKPMVNHKCEFCDRTFLRRDAMLNHRESHLGKTYQCHLCDRNYSTNMTLKSHIRKKHIKRETDSAKKVTEIVCEYCQRTFCNKASLKEHVRTRHSKVVQLFSCSQCQMKFTRRNSLRRHLKKSCRMTGDLDDIPKTDGALESDEVLVNESTDSIGQFVNDVDTNSDTDDFQDEPDLSHSNFVNSKKFKNTSSDEHEKLSSVRLGQNCTGEADSVAETPNTSFCDSIGIGQEDGDQASSDLMEDEDLSKTHSLDWGQHHEDTDLSGDEDSGSLTTDMNMPNCSSSHKDEPEHYIPPTKLKGSGSDLESTSSSLSYPMLLPPVADH